jgi:hypothetical protein
MTCAGQRVDDIGTVDELAAQADAGHGDREREGGDEEEDVVGVRPTLTIRSPSSPAAGAAWPPHRLRTCTIAGRGRQAAARSDRRYTQPRPGGDRPSWPPRESRGVSAKKETSVTHTPKKETGCPLLGFGLDRGIRGFGVGMGRTSGWVTRLHSEGVWGPLRVNPCAPMGRRTPAGPLGSPVLGPRAGCAAVRLCCVRRLADWSGHWGGRGGGYGWRCGKRGSHRPFGVLCRPP